MTGWCPAGQCPLRIPFPLPRLPLGRLRNGRRTACGRQGHLCSGSFPFQPHLAVEMAPVTSQIRVRGQRSEVGPPSYVLARPEALSPLASRSPALGGHGGRGSCQGNRRQKWPLHLCIRVLSRGGPPVHGGGSRAELRVRAAAGPALGCCSGRRGWTRRSQRNKGRSDTCTHSFLSGLYFLRCGCATEGPGALSPRRATSAAHAEFPQPLAPPRRGLSSLPR